MDQIITVPVEVRESEDGPRLHATIIQEGRAASELPEVFSPHSIDWPSNGVGIKLRHGQPVEVRAMPTRGPDGSIRIAVRATPNIVNAVQGGLRGMSIEFRALDEHRTSAGIREITHALMDGAALADVPVYTQGAAEIRERRRGWLWL